MKLIKKKIIQISSKGEINFIYSISKSFNKSKFYIKDNKNSLLSKKSYQFNSFKKSINYKKNIF